jgi:hypothetical protein
VKKSNFLLLFALAVIAMGFAASAPAQEKADTTKVVGAWKVEVYAGDQTFFLDLIISEENGQLAGKISESFGAFTDVAISDVFYDGVVFRFSFVSPTPPDGSSRTVKADFKLAQEAMGGTFSVPDLGVVADASATRAK